MKPETITRLEGTEDKVPDWWPYAPEFPDWHVWRGVAGRLRAAAQVEPTKGGTRQDHR